MPDFPSSVILVKRLKSGGARNLTRCYVNKLFSQLCIPLALLLGTYSTTSTYAQDDVLKWVPESSNAIAVVRVKDLLASKLAKTEKWSDSNRQAYAAGLTAAPPWASMVIRSTNFRPGSQDIATTYSLFVSDRTITIGEIARHDGTKAETISGRPAVQSNRNATSRHWVLSSSVLWILPIDRQQRVGFVKVPRIQTILPSPT